MELVSKKYNEYLIVFIILNISYEIIDKTFGTIYSVNLLEKGYSVLFISTVMAIYSLCLTIFDFPTGNLSDRIGRKKIASIGYIIWGIGLISFGISSHVILIILSIIIMTLGISFISGSPSSWFFDHILNLNLKEEKKHIFSKIRSFSILTGAIGCSLVYLITSLTFLFIIIGTFSIVIGISTLTISDENYGEIENENFLLGLFDTAKEIFTKKEIRNFLIISFFLKISFLSVILYWQLYYKFLGGQTKDIGFSMILLLLSLSLGSYINSISLKKYSNSFSYLVSIILGVISFIGFLFSKNTYFFISFAMLFEISLGFRFASLFLHLSDLIPSEKRASYFSAINAIESFFAFLIILSLGFVIDTFNYNAFWSIGLTSVIISFYYYKEIKENEVN